MTDWAQTHVCDRCGQPAAIRVRFEHDDGPGGWWAYCQEHAWPLDAEAMTWGGARRKVPARVHDVEYLT